MRNCQNGINYRSMRHRGAPQSLEHTSTVSRKRMNGSRRRTWLIKALLSISSLSLVADRLFASASDDYYAANNNGYYYNNQVDDLYQNGNAAADDDGAVQDDGYNAGYQGGDDAAAVDDYYAYNSNNNGDDGHEQADDGGQYQQALDGDDDVFQWTPNIGFDGVSVMPISCINYNNGHMIKFQLFDSAQSYQCHFAEISTFVVSIAHYMRAYFNYQALTLGQDFELPEDAAFLNCVQIDATTYANMPLYAKIGCMERETFTSTKLQLHVYTDSQCSQPYNDQQSSREHMKNGYQVGDDVVSSSVSFRVPFLKCQTCSAEASGTFNKKQNNWYDDDFINEQAQQDNEYGGENYNQGANNQDDFFDDAYLAANDDVNRDDDYANGGDDYYNGRSLSLVEQQAEKFRSEFWDEYDKLVQHRNLYSDYDVGDWNMCQRIYKYGVWCDKECRALDFFRRDQWSKSDVFLLGIMMSFMTAMMLLVIAKRLKAQQRARIYGDDQPMPGLAPFALVIVSFAIMGIIVTLAKLRFINETLVFAVVTCVLLFIYMLKLTLFENRKPVLLAAPRHDVFDNPLDDHFIE